MNDSILMEHLSLQLHTIIKKYSLENVLIEKACKRPVFAEPLETHQQTLENILSLGRENNTTIFSLNKIYYYSLVATENYKYLIGPLRLEIKLAPKECWDIELTEFFDDIWQNSVVIIENNIFFYNVLLLSNAFNSSPLSEEKLLFDNVDDVDFYKKVNQNLSGHLFDFQEAEIKHNSYEQELREQTSIEYGDIISLELALKEDIVGEIGKLAKDKVRHTKNLAIVIITLASRSAIRGGLSSEEAFSMADIYTQNIEETSDPSKLSKLMREAEREYTRRVHEVRKRKKDDNYHLKVNQCKNYVFSHLHSQISIHEIAAELDMNASYLSELFKKHEGISLSKYIVIEKIERAKNLLKYSEFTYIKIATYLGFCSQSHLGTHFKKHTGYTLKEYRDNFGNSLFVI